MKEIPHYLELEPFCVTKEDAMQIVSDELMKKGIEPPNGKWENEVFKDGENAPVSFGELVAGVESIGFVFTIQTYLDKIDEFFGGTYGMSAPLMGTFPVIATYAGFKKELTAPMSANPPEWDISYDILYYRQQSCLYSNEENFKLCTRYYRAYLTSCISLMDVFINKHVFVYKLNALQSTDFQKLCKTNNIEKKLELLLKISTGKDLTAISNSIEWQDFKILKSLRNETTHVNEPFIGYSIADIADGLNLVKQGVGGLLRLIRTLQGKPSLSFIESLKTAPIAYFNEMTEVDGKKVIKRRK